MGAVLVPEILSLTSQIGIGLYFDRKGPKSSGTEVHFSRLVTATDRLVLCTLKATKIGKKKKKGRLFDRQLLFVDLKCSYRHKEQKSKFTWFENLYSGWTP